MLLPPLAPLIFTEDPSTSVAGATSAQDDNAGGDGRGGVLFWMTGHWRREATLWAVEWHPRRHPTKNRGAGHTANRGQVSGKVQFCRKFFGRWIDAGKLWGYSLAQIPIGCSRQPAVAVRSREVCLLPDAGAPGLETFFGG